MSIPIGDDGLNKPQPNYGDNSEVDDLEGGIKHAAKVNVIRRSAGFLNATSFYVAIVGFVYWVASFVNPESVALALANKVALFALILSGYVLLISFVALLGSIDLGSFVEIDRKLRDGYKEVVRTPVMSKVVESILGGVGAVLGVDFSVDTKINAELKGDSNSSSTEKRSDENSVARKRYLGTAFENYICSVVESLDRHIYLTEEKASKLLDRGILFLFGGIVFYILAIIAWQTWSKIASPPSDVLYLGMAECSVVFIVCEFLAAWFLKQYRHYVDASLACMRVKSVYDRYLLSYYSVVEFSAESGDQSGALSSLLEVIKEDAQWPGHKDNVGNDFNYMLESMNSLHTAMGKMKGMFGKKGKSSKGSSKS